MTRLLPWELWIHVLKGDLPEEPGVSPNEACETARKELCRMTGEDFGFDGSAWQDWFDAQSDDWISRMWTEYCKRPDRKNYKD